MQVEIIAAMFDRCGRVQGSALGPEAIRYEFQRHERRDIRVQFSRRVSAWHSIESNAEREDTHGLRAFNQARTVFREVSKRVHHTLGEGRQPVVLGGDHSISIGSVSAANAWVKAQGGSLAVLWIDAHADMHSACSSASGNMHGMPLGLLSGRDGKPTSRQWSRSSKPPVMRDQWCSLYEEFAAEHPLQPQQVCWLGLRDVDLPEAKFIHDDMVGSLPITMETIDRYGIKVAFDRITDWMERHEHTHLWVSFDVDSLDPVLAPGTGTAVRGGLTYREGHLLAEMIYERCRHQLLGLDLVELNPVLDQSGATIRVATEWLASLYGKRILPWGPWL